MNVSFVRTNEINEVIRLYSFKFVRSRKFDFPTFVANEAIDFQIIVIFQIIVKKGSNESVCKYL